MKKFLTLILLVIAACLLGGMYGILHDQLTYSISPEYFTKFKFYQFGLAHDGEGLANPRLAVTFVGFLATWWMGIPIGIVLGFTGLIHENSELMLNVTLKAFLLTILITFIAGLVGLSYGYFFLASKPNADFSNWFIPPDLDDVKAYITVGSMHNFSYAGGMIGLAGGFIYSVLKSKQGLSPFLPGSKR